MEGLFRALLGALLLAVVASSCTNETTSREREDGTANPAVENCLQKGGQSIVKVRPGKGGQYGICLLEDNRQCEEEALLRGDCPAQGLKVTGYVTPAARYCAITGGSYKVRGAGNTPQEQGTCTLKTGTVCEVWSYYRGDCS